MGIKYKVNELRPGMVLDKDIVTLQGQTLANAGDELTRNLIARISFYSIFDVEIRPEEEVKKEEEAKKDVPAKEPPKSDNKTIPYSQKMKSTKVYQTFQMDYSRNLATMRGVFYRIQKEDRPNVDFNSILRDVSALFA